MTFLNNSSTARARIGKIFARWHVHLAIAIASTLNKYIHSAVQNDHSPVETLDVFNYFPTRYQTSLTSRIRCCACAL